MRKDAEVSQKIATVTLKANKALLSVDKEVRLTNRLLRTEKQSTARGEEQQELQDVKAQRDAFHLRLNQLHSKKKKHLVMRNGSLKGNKLFRQEMKRVTQVPTTSIR